LTHHAIVINGQRDGPSAMDIVQRWLLRVELDEVLRKPAFPNHLGALDVGCRTFDLRRGPLRDDVQFATAEQCELSGSF
jgi:hypothetical protein